jgi:queuosine precursor transporter
MPIAMHGAGPLPTEQHRYLGLPELEVAVLHRRRERVFLIMAGLFLGTLTMLNIIGVTRIVDLSFELPGVGRVPMQVAVGVLPYPLTFLCTDFICELYGRARANWVVFVGLLLNVWVVIVLALGGALPGFETQAGLFSGIRAATLGAVAASMIAYLAAQLIDVQLFHFWKRLTAGRHLWLRNNGSTLVSQLADTVLVILITHYWAGVLPVDHDAPIAPQLVTYIASGYVFKLVAAMVDTVPFYLGSFSLARYLRLPPPDSPPTHGMR